MRDSDRELCNRLEDEFCRTSSQRRSSFCRQLGIDFVVSETLLENSEEAEYLLNEYQYLVEDVADELESDEAEDMFSTE